jgi:hypothetical protein
MDSSNRNTAVKIMLIGLFLFSTIRLLTSTVTFGEESLQLDFSAFYTAGQSLNNGLSAYDNNIVHTPPVWDGAAFYKHSRFLYPPLVATLFRPWAILPYKTAKNCWMYFNILCLCAALFIAANISQLRLNMTNCLIMGISIGLFYPTLVYLERGQIDAVVLVLILLSVKLFNTSDRSKMLSGMILATATLIKIYCVLLIPFLLIRRKWKPVQGYVVGLILLLLLSFLFNGTQATLKYFTHELPRIAKYGEDGTQSMMLPKTTVKRQRGLPSEETSKDGAIYRMTTLKFIDNATIVRRAHPIFKKIGGDISRSVFSLLLFSVFFLLVALWHRRFGDYSEDKNTAHALVYWQIVLIIILLTSPLTWAMNAVWLLPAVVILLCHAQFRSRKMRDLFIGTCTAGLIIAAVPDHLLHAFSDLVSNWVNDKYIIAETIVLIALMGLYASKRKSQGQ